MSPEQLRGKPVDHRSDIFSFGAILYELMAGQRAFRGETEVDTMTAVLREEPPEAGLEKEADIPPGYRDIVKHCLEKDPANRFQSAKDLVFALQTLAGSWTARPIPLPQPVVRSTPTLPWTLAAVLAVATILLAAAQLLHAPAAPPTYQRLTSEAGTVYSWCFAPDGKSIVYSAAWNNKPVRLFTTVGDSLLTQPLAFSDAGLLAISPANELALVLHGTHDGQLETIDGMLARACTVHGSSLPRSLGPLFPVFSVTIPVDSAAIHCLLR